jgi:two-component system sensor histidine kinase DesK
MKLDLLPREPYARLAYLWLAYLLYPIVSLFVEPSGRWPVVATVGAILLFLPLYFWVQWVTDRRALAAIIGMAAIGLSLTPMNAGGAVFFVYAGSFAYRLRSRRTTAVIIVLIATTALADASLGAIAWRAGAWAAVGTCLIGFMMLLLTEQGRKVLAAQEQARHMAVVAERERIGRDLHDLLGHTLTVIALKAELASKVGPDDLQRALAEIRDVEQISRDALAEVRRAVQGSKAVAALTSEIERARAALSAAGVMLECDAEPVEASLDVALAFVVREAATNIIRHSHASRCRIRLWSQKSIVYLTIQDNGIGGMALGGSGIAGMQARIAALGGTFERIDCDGTTIRVTLPCDSHVARTPTMRSQA